MSVPGGEAQVGVVVPAWQLTGAVNNGGVARWHPLGRAGPTPDVPALRVTYAVRWHVRPAFGQIRDVNCVFA